MGFLAEVYVVVHEGAEEAPDMRYVLETKGDVRDFGPSWRKEPSGFLPFEPASMAFNVDGEQWYVVFKYQHISEPKRMHEYLCLSLDQPPVTGTGAISFFRQAFLNSKS